MKPNYIFIVFTAEVDVIYAKVRPSGVGPSDGENVLQKLADQIVEKFVSSGLMRREYDRVKLHLTVMNSLFRKKEGFNNPNSLEPMENFETKKEVGKRETIEARDILKAFEFRYFAETQINEIHLSQIKAGRRTEENYYYPSTVVRLSSCG